MKIQPRKISLSTKILAYTLAGLQAVFSGGVAWALPMNGTIVNGTGHISTSGNTMTIKQTSKTLTTNWQTFNINSGQVVKFIQPNSTPVSSTGSSDGSNSETTVLPDTISHNYTNVIPGVSVRVIDSGVNLHEE